MSGARVGATGLAQRRRFTANDRCPAVETLQCNHQTALFCSRSNAVS